MKRNGLRVLLIVTIVLTTVVGCATNQHPKMANEFGDAIITVSQTEVLER
jgi:hypothetical protein